MRPILVTGGAKGLGAEIAVQLAANGHDVLIHFRNSKKEAEEVVKRCEAFGVSARALQGDFATHEMLKKLIEELSVYSQVKGIVNNVGNYLIAPLKETENSDWSALFQTNFFAPVFLTKTLLPSICEQKGGIVNIGVVGLNSARAFLQAAAFTATKSALWSYTRSLAKEMAPHLIPVNMVSPSYLENAVDLPNLDTLPMKRSVSLRDAAKLVSLLFEEESRSITGQNIEITAGVGL